jgi:hypothetical protein
MSPHKQSDQKPMSLGSMLEEITSGIPEELLFPALPLLKPGGLLSPPFFEFVMAIHPIIRDLSVEGADGELLTAALMQLRDLEEVRPGGKKRKDLDDTLRCVENTKRAFIRTFRWGVELPAGTIRAMEMGAARIKQLIKRWDNKEDKWGRSPQTRIVIALMAHCKERTEVLQDPKLAELVSAAYKAAGSKRGCKAGSLRKLWERNSDLRKDWRSVLKRARKVHAPSKRRLLGIGPQDGFRPPEGHKSAVLGLQSHPKDVN